MAIWKVRFWRKTDICSELGLKGRFGPKQTSIERLELLGDDAGQLSAIRWFYRPLKLLSHSVGLDIMQIMRVKYGVNGYIAIC
jgi:hypothetical protein